MKSSISNAGGKLITNLKTDNMRKKPIEIWGFEGSAVSWITSISLFM